MREVGVEGTVFAEKWKRGLCFGFLLTLTAIVAGLLALFFIQGLPSVSASYLGSGGVGLPEGAATGGLY
jgi:hypothetical protein